MFKLVTNNLQVADNIMTNYKKILVFAIFLIFSANIYSTDFQTGFKEASKGNFANALKEWLPLAQQGHSEAQASLGFMYANGYGVDQSDGQALHWYRLAAEQGHAGAQNNLGSMYYFGKGVLQNYIYAHMWFNISSANGFDEASERREGVGSKMTIVQINQAQNLARQCLISNYQRCE